MTTGSLKANPTGPKLVILRHLMKSKYAFMSCYTKRLATHKKLKGTITATFAITRAGTVAGAKARGIKHDVAACVARTLATMRFGKSSRTIQYTWSFRFSTGDAFASITGAGMFSSTASKRYSARVTSLVSVGPSRKNLVRKSLNRRRGVMAGCYNTAVRLKPRVKRKTRMTGSFQISRRGTVMNPKAAGQATRVIACVRAALRRMRFPKASGATNVRFVAHFSRSWLSSGNIYGGLTRIKGSKGGYGIGKPGLGPGGGGTGWGTIGRGGYGTIGRGFGRGTGYGRRSSPLPSVRFGAMTRLGGLPPSIIRRYLRVYRSKLARCWELYAPNPKAGKISLSFTIGPKGRVTKVTAGGDIVGYCIKKALSKIRFPAPRGGGIVKVSIPSKFKAAPTVKPLPRTGRGGGFKSRKTNVKTQPTRVRPLTKP